MTEVTVPGGMPSSPDELISNKGASTSNIAEIKLTPAPIEIVQKDVQKDTILYFMYLLYKTNQITRHHVKHMLKIINAPMPTDLMKYFLEEVGKI